MLHARISQSSKPSPITSLSLQSRFLTRPQLLTRVQCPSWRGMFLVHLACFRPHNSH